MAEDVFSIRPESEPCQLEVTDPLDVRISHAHSFPTRAQVSMHGAVADIDSGAAWIRGHPIRESWADNQRVSNLQRWKFFWAAHRTTRPTLLVRKSKWNYYHWLIEGLPLAIRGVNFYHDLLVLLDPKVPTYATDALEILGIESEIRRGWVKPKTLVLPVGGSEGPWPHPHDVAAIRDAFLGPESVDRKATPSGNKLYISRKHSTRALDDEAEVETLLEQEGFTVVYAEELSFAEQIDLFSHASTVVANHGAGMTNLMFAPRGTQVIEIASRNNPNYCFENLSKVIGHTYARVFAAPGKFFDQAFLGGSGLSELVKAVNRSRETAADRNH